MTREEAKTFIETLAPHESWTINEVMDVYGKKSLAWALDDRLTTIDILETMDEERDKMLDELMR